MAIFKKKKEAKKKNRKPEKANTPEESVDYKDLYARSAADFQNFKRRVEKERATWERDAYADVIKRFLSVVDDIDRAVDSSKDLKDDSAKGVVAGLELVQKNLHKILSDFNVSEIDCSGQFNPDLHEALIEVDSPDHTSGDIVEVMSKGYVLSTRRWNHSTSEDSSTVLRHAKVSVAK